MRRTFFVLLLLMPVSVWAQSGMTPQQAGVWFANTKHMHIVDIRETDAYMAGTLKGAIHVTLEQLRSMQPESEAHVLLIADRVDERLLPKGYAELRLLAGTPAQWHRAGLHVVRIKVIRPAFVIPRGLCETNEPADKHDAETEEEEWK